MQVGNKIILIDDDLQGVITQIEGESITFESNDGFLYTLSADKMVVTNSQVEEKFLQGNPHKVATQTKPVSKKHIGRKIPVFDLHIEKVQVKHQHLSAGQKLQIQLNEANRIIIKMQQQKQQTFILVHGIGKGVLKNELKKLLKKQKIQFDEVSFTKFGQAAALQVFLK